MAYQGKIGGADPRILADKVASIGDGEATVRRNHNLTAEELNELMLDNGYERCKGLRMSQQERESRFIFHDRVNCDNFCTHPGCPCECHARIKAERAQEVKSDWAGLAAYDQMKNG